MMSDAEAPEGFLARTSTSIAPDLVPASVYGQHRSEVVPGPVGSIRLWHFEQKSGRDAFVKAISEGKFRRRRVAP